MDVRLLRRWIVRRDEALAILAAHEEELAALGVASLRLFGSVARGEAGPDSDVDLLVEFEPGFDSWRAVEAAKAELSALLGGRDVDLIRRQTLNRWIRPRVFAEAEVLYDRDAAGRREDGRTVRPPRAPTMTERDILYLGQMLDNAREAIEIAREADEARFESDRVLRLALTRLVQVVGEAARKASPEGRVTYPEIPWRSIVGMRHILVHEYEGLRESMVWETVVEDLPKLVATLEAALPEPPS